MTRRPDPYEDADDLRDHLQRLGVPIMIPGSNQTFRRIINGAEVRTNPFDDSVTVVLHGRAAAHLADMLATIPEHR